MAKTRESRPKSTKSGGEVPFGTVENSNRPVRRSNENPEQARRKKVKVVKRPQPCVKTEEAADPKCSYCGGSVYLGRDAGWAPCFQCRTDGSEVAVAHIACLKNLRAGFPTWQAIARCSFYKHGRWMCS